MPLPAVLISVSSPSGAGKTTLCQRLMAEFPDLRFSVSTTTRSTRSGEVEGVDYPNVVDAEFDRMIAADAFVEWADVHGRRYGTTRAEVELRLANARREVSNWPQFDYIVINDDRDRAYDRLRSIVVSEACRRVWRAADAIHLTEE